MEYFKLIYDYKNDDNAIFLTIDESNLTFGRYDVNKKGRLSIDKILCSVKQKNLSNYDYLANNLAWLIVSGKAKDIMAKHKIKDVEFIPVVNCEDNSVIGYLVHCMNIIDALDEKNSLCKRMKYFNYDQEHTRLSVIKYAIREELVNQYDLFKLNESNIPFFVSKKIKDDFTNEKVKGFDFLKIKMS